MAAPSITGTVLRDIYLECRTGGHWKGYRIYVTMDAAAAYSVTVHHGRIGALNQGKVYLTSGSHRDAMDKAVSLVADKTWRSKKEPYVEVSDQQFQQQSAPVVPPSATAPTPRLRSASKPQALPKGAVLF